MQILKNINFARSKAIQKSKLLVCNRQYQPLVCYQINSQDLNSTNVEDRRKPQTFQMSASNDPNHQQNTAMCLCRETTTSSQPNFIICNNSENYSRMAKTKNVYHRNGDSRLGKECRCSRSEQYPMIEGYNGVNEQNG